MTRHLLYSIGLAAVATATALFLAEAGVFEGVAHWLFARFEAESLTLRRTADTLWPQLSWGVAGAVAFVVALVAVDASTWTSKLLVFGTGLAAVAFLSLTLAFYGVAYAPWPALAAAMLAFAMGCLVAETPAGRERRTSHLLLARRASSETLEAWTRRGLTSPWISPGVREGAVLAVRLLSPAPAPEAVAPHLVQRSRSLGDAVRLLRGKPGVIIDVPTGDGIRAFFGFRPDASGGDLKEAGHAALELATLLREEATLQAQAGQPSSVWGIGVSVGPLVIGAHGPEPDVFWTATGNAVEQARQLAALNARHHTTILVGRRAAEALVAHFELRAVEGDAIHALLAARQPSPPEDLPIAQDTEWLADPKPAQPPLP